MGEFGWAYVKGALTASGPTGSIQFRDDDSTCGTGITGSANLLFLTGTILDDPNGPYELRLTGSFNMFGDQTIDGNLTVVGSTTTISASNLIIQDPVIGLGFGTASAHTGAAGDRGFIFGLRTDANQALIWDQTSASFIVGKVGAVGPHNDPGPGDEAIYDINEDDLSVFKVGGIIASGTTAPGLGEIYGLSMRTSGDIAVSGAAVFNDVGGDNDFRVESDDNANMLFVDASTDRVGVGTATPLSTLHLYGSSGEVELRIQSDTAYTSIVQKDNNELIIQNAATDGVIIFHDDTAERMRIDKDGKVGINDSTPTAMLNVQGTADSAVPTLLIDHDDADVIGVQLNFLNSTANAIDIDAFNTTANVIDVAATSLTTGKALFIDAGNATTTTTNAGAIAHIDFDKTGIVASGQTSTFKGFEIDMDDAANNAGTSTMTGMDIGVVNVDAGDGTTQNVCLNVSGSGADKNYGLQVCVDDHADSYDIVMSSSLNNNDYGVIYVGADGVMTLATVDQDAANANIVLAPDGKVSVSSNFEVLGTTTLGDASGDSVTIYGATVNIPNVAAGTDNTVLVYNGSSIVTDEIDSRVWGSTLVDGTNGTDNELAIFTDSNSVEGDSNLTWDGSTLDVGGALTVDGNTTLGDASGDTATINAQTIVLANVAAGTDNTVLVYNGSTIVTDEIDSRVWGSTLIDASGTPSNNQIAVWTDANTVEGEGSLTYDSDTSVMTLTDSYLRLDNTGAAASEHALFIDSVNTTVQVAQIKALNTTSNVIEVTGSALTTGGLLHLQSDSSDAGNRTLFTVHNDNTAAVGVQMVHFKNDAVGGAGDPILLVESTAAETEAIVEIRNSNTATDKPPILKLNRASWADADDMGIGTIIFQGVHDAASWPDNIEYATIVGTASDTAEDDEGGKIVFNVYAGGQAGTAASTNLLSIGGEVKDGAVCEVVVNDAGIDCDFRIEGDSETHLIFAEAANDRVSIGASVDSPAATLEVTNASDGGVPLIQLNSNDTDKTALDINANNIDASVVDITANAVTTAAALNIDANALTTGAGLVVASTSTQTGAASALVAIKSNGDRGHASNRHSGLFIDFDSTAGTAAAALYIDSEQTTGMVVDIDADALTAGTGINISADALTTGTALAVADDSSNTGTRNTVLIKQDNVAAIAATALTVQSDGGITGMTIDKNYSEAGSNNRVVSGLVIDFDKTGDTDGDNTLTGISVDMDNATATDGDNTMTGIRVTPTLTHASDAGTTFITAGEFAAVGSANGTSKTQGLDVRAESADNNLGIVIVTTDGGTQTPENADIVIKSSAAPDDYFSLKVGTDAETVIETVENSGGSTAHLTFKVDGNMSSSAAHGVSSFYVQSTGSHFEGGGIGVHVVGNKIATGSLGVNAHYDPTSLKVSTGGGDVVLFGADTANTMAANRLVYLNTSGEWIGADADAVGSSGGVLLGICLGADPSDGVLLRGFHHLSSVQGSFAKGAACYVSEAIGEIDFTAPSDPGDVVRVVGFGTSVTNVIYFNPDNTWIEL